jgi:hypothetical protein
MGKEHDEILAHNLDASLEVAVVLSFKLQLNHWDVCGLVTLSVSKVQEVNLWTNLWPPWAKDRVRIRICVSIPGKPSLSKQGGNQILIKI